MIFANSLDRDLARRNVAPDLEPNFFTLVVFLNFFLERSLWMTKNPGKLPTSLMLTFFNLINALCTLPYLPFIKHSLDP